MHAYGALSLFRLSFTNRFILSNSPKPSTVLSIAACSITYMRIRDREFCRSSLVKEPSLLISYLTRDMGAWGGYYY